MSQVPIFNLTSMSYRNIDKQEAVLFSTYSGLVSHEGLKAAERDAVAAREEGDEGARRAAAQVLGGGSAKRTRLNQIATWMQGTGPAGKIADAGNGCLLFDECHKAKNLLPGAKGQQASLTAKAVVELQEMLPKARVVYCSATGASSVQNMAYMERLGLWGADTCFPSFTDFAAKIGNDRVGFGAMELVSLDMKQRGMYLSRALSYRDAKFETIDVALSPEQTRVYDSCARFWQTMQQCFEEARDKVNECDGWVAPKHAMSQFWGAHQRFFRQLCMAMKVPTVVQMAKAARKAGKCVVIGLQTTGEARLKEAMASEDDLEDFRGTQVSAQSPVIPSSLVRYPLLSTLPPPLASSPPFPMHATRLQPSIQGTHLPNTPSSPSVPSPAPSPLSLLQAIIEHLLQTQFPTRGERDEDEDEDDHLQGDGRPRPGGLPTAATSSSNSGGAGSSGGGAGGSAAQPMELSDSDEDIDFLGDAKRQREAIERKATVRQLDANRDSHRENAAARVPLALPPPASPAGSVGHSPLVCASCACLCLIMQELERQSMLELCFTLEVCCVPSPRQFPPMWPRWGRMADATPAPPP